MKPPNHAVLFLILLPAVAWTTQASGQLPEWVGDVSTTPPNNTGIGSITLSGTWLDTCAPDMISHVVESKQILLTVEHDGGIAVGCGDQPTPWSLTEQFGPLAPANYSIFGSLYAVDPQDRTVREFEFGPDLLVSDYVVVSEPATVLFLVAELPGEEINNDSYVVPLNDPADISHARRLIEEGLGIGQLIVHAGVAPGPDGINRDHLAPGEPEWSWHVSEFLGFTDVTAEILDGWPSFVEQDVQGWVNNTNGQIGFWG